MPDIWKDEVYVDYRKTVMLVCEFANLPNLEDRVRAMAEDRQRLQAIVERLHTPRTIDDWHEDVGNVLWW